MVAEHGREVSLRLEAYAQRNLSQRKSRIPEHVLGPFNAPAQYELVGPYAGGGPKLGGEVHPAEARGTGKIGKSDWVGEIGIYELDNTPVPPFDKASILACARGPRRAGPAHDPGEDRGGDALGVKLSAGTIQIVTREQRERETAYDRIRIGKPKLAGHIRKAGFAQQSLEAAHRHEEMQEIAGTAVSGFNEAPRLGEQHASGGQASVMRRHAIDPERHLGRPQVYFEDVTARASDQAAGLIE
jgi:hypothetical protein